MNLPAPDRQLEPGYVIDTKRGVVVNKQNLNTFQNFIYTRNFYKQYRPDLNDYSYQQFREKWMLGEAYMGVLKQKLNHEIARLYMQNSFTFRREKSKVFEEQVISLTNPHIRGPRWHAQRNWQEATIIVNYVDQLLAKVFKYGLQYPALAANQFTNIDQVQQFEKDLTARFVREMRKTEKV